MKFVTLCAALFLLSCAQHPITTKEHSSEQLHFVVDAYTDQIKHLDTYDAPYFNVEENLEKFGDFQSDEYWKRSEKIIANALDGLRLIKADRLSPSDRMTYQLFKTDMETALRDFQFPFRFLILSQMGSRLSNFMNSANQALTDFPFDSVKHYDAYIKRARGFPDYVDREIQNLRSGVQSKVTLSCPIVDRVPESYKDALEITIDKNPFYKPIKFMPASFPEADRQRLSTAFADLIRERLLPAYQKFDSFLRKEYRPHCRKEYGIAGFPNGAEWYRHLILSNTNLSASPKEIHELGLKEVARINSELRKVQHQLGFRGGLSAFRKSIVEDEKSSFKSAEEMFAAFEAVNSAVAQKIPAYFSLIPKSEFRIVSTTNPEDASGSYHQPTELHPYGRFVVNTINIKSVPKYDITTLFLHEAVPGHHFQLALQFEAKDRLSEYQRKIYAANAFVEGWALYVEFLGNEMGLFSDPLQRFGHLNDEMLRAVRLVVDTGIHAMSWSQSKAVSYMRENLALDAKDILNEANRYSVWPGQALGYKIGQLKILELRRKAEKALGSRFDIREFHTAVIGNGSVSLTVLEIQINDWIKKKSTQTL